MRSRTVENFVNAESDFQKNKPYDYLSLTSFSKKSNKYCLSQMPNTFIGLEPPIDHYSNIMNELIS